MKVKAFGILVLLVLIDGLGCVEDSPAGPGTIVAPPLPAPVSCPRTENDLKNGIGVGVCGDLGVDLMTHDDATGFDVKCYRCSGEFNAEGTQPVPPEGCYVFRSSAPIAGLCVNSCKQCGSTHDNY